MGVKRLQSKYGGFNKMDRIYLPEGNIYFTEENRLYTSDLKGLEKAMEEGVILEARAGMCDACHNLYVDFGFCRGIIPRSEAVYSPSGEAVKDIAIITRVGKIVCFVVTSVEENENGTFVMLSRRIAQKKCCDEYIRGLSCGDVIEASVTHTEKFGAFCDIGCGMPALLPVDCISVSRIEHPSERFSTGQRIMAAVKAIESDICRITLSHKELLGTWLENTSQFEPGQTVTGIVRSIEPYGIFVELTPNLAGLAEWCDGIELGGCVSVYIKSIIPEKMKIKLVIVDTGCEREDGELVYYTDSPHLDFWRYSPEGCKKEIYTEFE